MIDIGTWLSGRGNLNLAVALYRLALHVGPDLTSRHILMINGGVAKLRNRDREEAYVALNEIVVGAGDSVMLKHLVASYYNLGLACRRTGRAPEAVRLFNEESTAGRTRSTGKRRHESWIEIKGMLREDPKRAHRTMMEATTVDCLR